MAEEAMSMEREVRFVTNPAGSASFETHLHEKWESVCMHVCLHVCVEKREIRLAYRSRIYRDNARFSWSSNFFRSLIHTTTTMGDYTHFRPIGEQVLENEENKPMHEIESLCMECGKQGITRLLPTYIPFFREVIVMSFSCPHCGNRNSEVQSAGEIQPKGCTYTIHITTKKEMNRQIIKSEFCTLSVPELQLQIPARRGQITTVEGILQDTLRDLGMDQPVRKHMQPDVYEKIEDLCRRLREMLGERASDETDVSTTAAENAQPLRPFKVVLDDPSGNSFVEYTGPIESSGGADVKWSKRDYARTKEQNIALGIMGDPQTQSQEAAAESQGAENGGANGAGGGFDKETGETEFDNEQIYTFPGTCSSCNAPVNTNMKKVNIPYFKDILIMSTACDHCGYRDNEVKSGSAISDHGRKLTLRVNDSEDLSRDILKAESAGLSIPEIDLYLAPGTLGGRFTTLEGLLQNVYDELYEKVLLRGDSAAQKDVNAFEGFLGKLKRAISAEACPYTVILDDPLADSYIQNPYAPDPDEQLHVENYTRSFEQNEVLGLNDMNVDHYTKDASGGADTTEKQMSSSKNAATPSATDATPAPPA